MRKLFFLIAAVMLLAPGIYQGINRQSFGQSASKRSDAKPVRPFSQAVKAGGFIFVSGQIGLDPETGKAAGEDIASQTRQSLKNIQAVLKKAGAGLDDVVKTTVFLQNMDDYQAMNRAYAEFFGANRPARATVAVRKLVLGVLIEIDAIARDPEAPGEIIRM